jgi:VCBS repeat protein/ASPIC/UnbV protein/type IX secretion system substrate protein
MKFIIATLLFCFSANCMSQILFNESSASQNINASFVINVVTGGVSFYDFDNDGWDDITYASEEGSPIYFFKNNNMNSGTFTSINLNFSDLRNDTRQVIWVDIDNDGDNDLFVVSNNASNRLYENDGALNFTDITEVSGISTAIMYSWGASWGDIDNDGYLDLFLSNRDIPNRVQPNILYKNNGDKTFTNVNDTAGIDNNSHLSFCSSFFDFNNDGWQDIYVANDKAANTNILYKNNGDGTFTDVSASSGTNLAIDAMSTTIDDYDNDGWLDIYVTNTSAGNYFLKNNGDETFTNIALSNGTVFNSIAWGAVFLDADNDTDSDLYVSGMRDGTNGSLPSAFYENTANMFTIPASAGFANDNAESFSNAIGDVNNDGYPDITVVNRSPRNHFLWINESNSNVNNNWLKVTLEGNTSNKMGIGSKIEIMVNGGKQYRYTLCGEGYISQNSGAEFFGIGNATKIDYVKVKWLSGIEDIIFDVTSNQLLHIVESSTLSVEENKMLENQIKIYPNPNKGKFKISIPNIIENFNIGIYNSLGQKVYYKTDLRSEEFIHIKNLSKGIYFIKIMTEKGVASKNIYID